MGIFRRRGTGDHGTAKIDATLRDATATSSELQGLLEPLPQALRERIIADARTAVRYGVSEAGSTTSRSRLGGLPNLPADIAWPSWTRPDGAVVPLNFFAQLDLSDSAELDILLPAEGLLLLFADHGGEDGILGLYENEHDGVRAVHVPYGSPGRPAPDNATTFSPLDLVPVLVTTLRLPGPAADDGRDDIDDEAWETFEGLEDQLRLRTSDRLPAGVELSGTHQLGGHASWIQHPVEEEVLQAASGSYSDAGFNTDRWASVRDQVDQWRTIAAIDSENRNDMMWGDAGTVYFVADLDTLNAQRFEDIWFNMQCS